jgi:hypothetical protein
VTLSGTTTGETFVGHVAGHLTFWMACYFETVHPTLPPSRDAIQVQVAVHCDNSEIAHLASIITGAKIPCRLTGWLEYYRSGRIQVACKTLTVGNTSWSRSNGIDTLAQPLP